MESSPPPHLYPFLVPLLMPRAAAVEVIRARTARDQFAEAGRHVLSVMLECTLCTTAPLCCPLNLRVCVVLGECLAMVAPELHFRAHGPGTGTGTYMYLLYLGST
ncbi:hypothetical protein J3F83DRAFT_739003 [Trichoderma novae-zelandiae]